MITKIKTALPTTLEPMAIQMWYFFRPVVRFVFHGRKRYCPICESWSRFFLSHGTSTRPLWDAVCPVCLSHERHRLAWVFLKSATNLNDGSPKKMLHFAPETEFKRQFRKIPGIEYLSADIDSPHARERIDITDIYWPDASFEVIYCSHVLEHVQDDLKAMREMFRVLKPGGWALIQVPVSEQPTVEDPSITDPLERERLFWWSDHMRLYGLDVTDRLAAAGFDVEVVFGHQLVQSHDRDRMRVHANEPLFYCTKLAS